MKISDRTLRRLVVLHSAAWVVAAFVGAALLTRSHAVLEDWLEPVRSEIPDWALVGLGISDGIATIPNYSIEIDPQVLRAARLMAPTTGVSDADRFWFPARFSDGIRSYRAEAQLAESNGLHLRFNGRARPDGMRRLELLPSDASQSAAHALSIAALESARELGLIASPSGFATLRVNGAEPTSVLWTEGHSDAMLERLGFPKGEIFAADSRTTRRPVREAMPVGYHFSIAAPRHATAERVSELWQLVRSASDQDFQASIRSRVDVEKVLSWSALAELFSGSPGALPHSPHWFFDPVTGLVEPVVRDLVSAVPHDPARDAERLVERLLAIPRYHARQQEIQRALVGADRSPLLAHADERLAARVARLASSLPWQQRITKLGSLATLRREQRGTLASHALQLRAQLAKPRPALALALASIASAEPAEPRATRELRAAIRDSGLRLRVRGDQLVLPAGRHLLARTLVVPEPYRLVIEPGVQLTMAPKTSLITFRGLQAVGTRKAPIDIRAADPERPWGAIGVARAPESSELAYLTVSGGSQAKLHGIVFSGQLSFNASDVVIRDTDVRDAHGDDAVSVKRAFFQVARSRFIDNASDGFDAEWSNGAIEQSLFANNGDDGLDLAGSHVSVKRAWFRRMGDKAISAGERSVVQVTDSHIVDSQIAIAAKEDSRVDVRGTEFRRNEIGISLYRDKPIFGTGSTVVTGGLFAENVRDFAVEPGSGLTLNGVERLTVDPRGLVLGSRDSGDAVSAAIP